MNGRQRSETVIAATNAAVHQARIGFVHALGGRAALSLVACDIGNPTRPVSKLFAPICPPLPGRGDWDGGARRLKPLATVVRPPGGRRGCYFRFAARRLSNPTKSIKVVTAMERTPESESSSASLPSLNTTSKSSSSLDAISSLAKSRAKTAAHRMFGSSWAMNRIAASTAHAFSRHRAPSIRASSIFSGSPERKAASQASLDTTSAGRNSGRSGCDSLTEPLSSLTVYHSGPPL